MRNPIFKRHYYSTQLSEWMLEKLKKLCICIQASKTKHASISDTMNALAQGGFLLDSKLSSQSFACVAMNQHFIFSRFHIPL